MFERYFRTLKEALTRKEIILGGVVVTAVTGAIAYYPKIARFLTSSTQETLVGVPGWAVATVVGSLVLSYFLLVYATRLRESLEPQLKLSFDQHESGIAITPIDVIGVDANGQRFVERTSGTYIRIHIETVSKKGVSPCVPYIVAIAKRKLGHGPFTSIAIHNPIGLAEVTVRPSIKAHADFLSCSKLDGRMQITPQMPLALQDAFVDLATYRFAIRVYADDTHRTIGVDVTWKGQYDTITAEQADQGEIAMLAPE